MLRSVDDTTYSPWNLCCLFIASPASSSFGTLYLMTWQDRFAAVVRIPVQEAGARPLRHCSHLRVRPMTVSKAFAVEGPYFGTGDSEDEVAMTGLGPSEFRSLACRREDQFQGFGMIDTYEKRKVRGGESKIKIYGLGDICSCLACPGPQYRYITSSLCSNLLSFDPTCSGKHLLFSCGRWMMAVNQVAVSHLCL